MGNNTVVGRHAVISAEGELNLRGKNYVRGRIWCQHVTINMQQVTAGNNTLAHQTNNVRFLEPLHLSTPYNIALLAVEQRQFPFVSS